MEMKTQKIQSSNDLKIRPTFPYYNRSKHLEAYMKGIKDILIRFLPEPLPFTNQKSLSEWVSRSLPLMTWTGCEGLPDCFSIFFLSRPLNSLPIETFLTEMIKRWLMPHQETNILSFEQMHFCFDFSLKDPLFIAEVKILVSSKKEWDIIQENLPLLSKEVFQAIQSGRFAKSILETKTLPLDHKMNLIQEMLIRVLRRFPDEFDQRIFRDLSYVQVTTPDDFRQQRTYLHLVRIIVSLYLMRERLDRELKAFPEKRHMMVRFLRTQLKFPFGQKPVLGLAIGVNLFHKYESFEEKHILLSVQKFITDVRVVPGSLFNYQPAQSPILSLYIELEKEDGSFFTIQEVRSLKQNLSDELSKRIEHLVPSLFMVRNEEETMRNILILSEELKEPDDLPQMMVSFDQHSQDDLIFTVVLLRVKKKESLSIQEQLKNADQRIRVIPDRIQIVSYLEKDYPIEANVFRLQISKLPIFLRMDFSVNLYLARQEVVAFLNRSLGEIRDYNGGMILKQGELLSQFKRLFKDISKKNQELLENFFYSLNPIESQATIPLKSLSLFFDLFLKLVEREDLRDNNSQVAFERDDDTVFAAVRADDSSFRPEVEENLSRIDIHERLLVSSKLSFEGVHYLCYLYSQDDPSKQEQFKEAIIAGTKNWEEEKEKLQVLRLSFHDFISLDPRIGGDQESSSIVRMLFDGLIRLDEEGVLKCSVAKSYEVSEDKKRYTFKLRETFWSNGSPVIAYDFEYAWKKMLSPDFSTPFAYVFYPIVNAKLAKEGKVPVDQVGVKAIDNRTLVVNLEHPAPYFIELTSGTLYSPVNHVVDKAHPNWAAQKNEDFVCNGPFKLKQPRPAYTYELEKNSRYWNCDNIKLDQVIINRAHGKIALEMFNKKQIDFLGFPICPIEDVALKEVSEQGISFPAPKVFWFCLNVNHFPFNHLKMRQAFGHALNRERIKKIFPYHKKFAFTPLPLVFTYHLDADFLIREDEKKAKALFDEALIELGMKKEEFPVVYISVSNAGIKRKMAEAVKAEWERIFGIRCEVEAYEWHDLFRKMTEGNFQVGAIHWTSWINDPVYTLNSFKYRQEKVNFSRWENAGYQELLNFADQEVDPQKRDSYLAQAEEILIREVVVLPIFYEMHWYIKSAKRPDQSLFFPKALSNGNFDFSQVYFEKVSLQKEDK